jgi:hypothetical protein
MRDRLARPLDLYRADLGELEMRRSGSNENPRSV